MNPELADAAPSAAFRAVALEWGAASAGVMFNAVWHGYDSLNDGKPELPGDERSITQALAWRIDDELTGDEPFALVHGAYEYATRKPPPAQPPQYDMAFVSRKEERVMWPLEAKLMETANQTAEYIADLKNQFLTCRYAPYTGFGAMVEYLRTGEPAAALEAVSEKSGYTLSSDLTFAGRPHRTSFHVRDVPEGKMFQSEFTCHHLIMHFPWLGPRDAEPS